MSENFRKYIKKEHYPIQPFFPQSINYLFEILDP